ncbi:hypothetical protein [Actinoplanes sp. NPDC089786]|uniref:hypothetical protein n=1 Tax=Actinoplanes sp. NPDC089786 TaxID=3155185 RepID=UPI00343F1CFF
MTTTPDLIPAIRRAGELLASAREGLGHLFCGEIQGVIDLLLAAGLRDTAIDVITSHAMGDDDADDLHHHIYLASTDGDDDPNELAGQMVDAQLRGEPLLKWRNLLPSGEIAAYPTKSARDSEAPYLAEAWNATILTEVWDRSHPQDESNQGWALDGTVKPTA